MSTRTLLVTALAGLGLTACLPRTSFDACRTDADCTAASVAGHCEADHACSVDDHLCPGGHRYVPSAPHGGQCVEPGDGPDASPDGARSDGAVDAPPGPPSSSGRECIKGGTRAADTACAADICAAEPRCCAEQWDATCVRLAETRCDLRCSTMAFIGGTYAHVLATDGWKSIWDDQSQQTDVGTRGGYWADFDNDGDEDLATVGDNELRIYVNDGYDGTHLKLTRIMTKLWAQIAPNASLAGRTGAWVDFDGDGDLDLAFGGFGGLVTLENRGDQGFAVKQVVYSDPAPGDTDAAPSATQTSTMGWGDVDGDHDLDLIVGEEYADARLYLNDGHGNLTLAPWDGPYGTEAVQFCNLDSDPAPEVVLSGNSYLTVFQLTGAGIESLAQARPIAQNAWLFESRCGDLDRDGDLDVFSSGWGVAPRVFLNDGTGATGLTQTWGDGTETPHQWGMDLGDLDGDGRLDAIATGPGYDATRIIEIYTNVPASPGHPMTFTRRTIVGEMIGANDVELGALPPVTP